MKRVNDRDRELLRKFRLKQEVQIIIWKLKLAPINTNDKNRISEAVKPQLTCSNFDFSCTKGKQLTCHIRTEHEPTLFKCSECQYSGRTKQYLEQHERTHSSYQRYKCPQCSYKTNNTEHLKRHRTARHTKNPEDRPRNFPCQLCSKSFFKIFDLRQHTSTHTKEKPFPCQFCSRSFAKKGDRKHHEIICYLNPKQSDKDWVADQKRFICSLCGAKRHTKTKLTAHMTSHSLERPFKCDMCDYAGASACRLKLHKTRINNHNKIKTVRCQLCPKTFLTAVNLKFHIVTHTKETPFECEFCKRQFSRRGDRARHLKICKLNPKKNDTSWVEAQKKFKCQLCKYSSIHNYKLQKHLETHKENKRVKCPFCEHTYAETYELNIHMRSHTGERPFKCLHCPYGTARSGCLTEHIRRLHKLLI